MLSRAEAEEELKRLGQLAQENLFRSLSANTRRAYQTQWDAFEAWCHRMGQVAAPATTTMVLAYLTARASEGIGVSTLNQAYGAILEWHRLADLPLPRLDGKEKRSWLGAKKMARLGKKKKQARAITPDEIRRIARDMKDDGSTLRDRAMILIGFCAATRRDELAQLDIRNIQVTEQGLKVEIEQSKTDQEGEGYVLGIMRAEDPSVCPVVAWQAYLAERTLYHEGEAPLEDEPAFISIRNQRLCGGDVHRRLMKRAKEVGIPLKDLSAHSLRAGCVTAASDAGFSLEEIMRQSRHKNVSTVLMYIRAASIFKGNVTKGLL